MMILLSVRARWALAAALLLLPAPWGPPPARAAEAASVLVDDFEDAARWSARPSDGVELKLSSDSGLRGKSLRLDFRFLKGGGYAVIHRDLSLDLPGNYAFKFKVRGQCLSNDLEFKLADSSGDNVWWHNRRHFEFPAAWDSLASRKRHISFAWGPAGGGDIRHVASIEFAVTAGSGGTGTVWLDDLEMRPLPPPGQMPPLPVLASSSLRPGAAPARAAAPDSIVGVAWRKGDPGPWLRLDLGENREFGGVRLDWAAGRHAVDYALESSSDGTRWKALRTVLGGNGGRDYLYLPESEARLLRLHVLRPSGNTPPELRALKLEPLSWSATREAFFQAIARDAIRGTYPRGMSGEQVYWTVVGADSDSENGLLSEDGALEAGKGGCTIEPFLRVGGRLIGWSDVQVGQALAGGSMPMPSVMWAGLPVRMAISARGIGAPGTSSILATYGLENPGDTSMAVDLYLVVRPFQVNPPAQFLNSPGGVSPIRDLDISATFVTVNGIRTARALTPPDRAGVLGFDQGDPVEWLREGKLPPAPRVHDEFGAASGVLAWHVVLKAKQEKVFGIQVALRSMAEGGWLPAGRRDSSFMMDSLVHVQSVRWRERLRPVRLDLPMSGADVANSLRAQLGYILVNRSGPALQPGTRSYDRSWIRDGALMASALLRLGESQAVKDYLLWYTGQLFENGKVPCCVDRRGPDPVPENDSGGEYLYLMAEYYRYTGDRETVEALWPNAERAVAYLDMLRRQRRGDAYRAKGKEEFFGLLPESISHEGYSAKPMHSYWDDFFALRGFKDAAFLAGVLGKTAEQDSLAGIRDEFSTDLGASVRAAMRARGIDYIPGCAELGDFDATSTTIAINPTGAVSVLPDSAVRRTFEKYWEFFDARRKGAEWEAFTPYEMRTIGAFVQLGWRDRAQELLEFFMEHRKPKGWAQWPEVVWKDPRAPHFIGDLPHTWVGSDFVRSVLDMIAYERESDSSLVVAAGIPGRWIRDPKGVRVQGLRTAYGALDLSLLGGPTGMAADLSGKLRIPPGGLRLSLPLPAGRHEAMVNGNPAEWTTGGDILIRSLPARVRIAF